MSTIYANSETGSDKAPGSAGKPVRSLGRACALASRGDTIEATGVFGGFVVTTGRLALVGNGATILAQGKPHGILIFASRVSVRGFTIEGSDGGGIAAARGADFITIRDNLIRNNHGNGISLIGGAGHLVHRNRIVGNIGTKDRHSSGISILNPRAVNTDAAYQIKVLENVIRDNGTLAATDGFGMIADKWTVSTPTPFEGWALIADNEFSGNWNSGFYAYHANNLTLRGNTFTGNGADPRFRRAVEIGLNDAQNVRLLGNINTSDRPGLALLGGTSGVELAPSNRLGAMAPWSQPMAA